MIGDDLRDRLVLRAVSLDNAFLAHKTQEDVLSSTISSLKRQTAESSQDLPLRKPVIDILVWLVQQRRTDLLSDIPVVSMKVKTDSPCPFSKLSTTERLLAPPEQWKSISAEFAELFPPDLILSSEYNDLFTMEGWRLLAEKQLVYLGPLFDETMELDNQLVFPTEESDSKEHQLEAIKCSRIAFLEHPRDRGIVDRVRKSKARSVLFFRFLLSCAIKNDSKWSETIDVPCECGKTHAVFPSHWFYYVKSRKWIPSQDSGSEALSAQSLAALLEGEQSLILTLKEDKPAKFLNRLGIGVGELLRNIVAGDDDTKKLEWDKAFGAILTSGLDPAKLVIEFEEREKNKQKVIANQKLGKRIESIFEMTFKSAEFKALGFSIERKPIVRSDVNSGHQTFHAASCPA